MIPSSSMTSTSWLLQHNDLTVLMSKEEKIAWHDVIETVHFPLSVYLYVLYESMLRTPFSQLIHVFVTH